MSTTHDDIQEQLDRLFVGDNVPTILEVREHLKHCPQCRAYFDTLAEADMWLNSAEEVEETFESRYSLAVMEAVHFQAARLAPDIQPEPVSVWQQFGRWLQTYSWAPALAAGVAALTMVWLATTVGDNPHDDDTFTPRGLQSQVEAPARIQSIGLFCVEHRPDGDIGFYEADAEGTLTCAQNEELKFGLINAAPRQASAWSYVTLVGRLKDNPESLRWYLPKPPSASGAASIPITPAERLKPLGETLRLSVHHNAGESIEVVAIFSEIPLPKEELEHRLQQGDIDLDGMESRGVVLGSSPRGHYAVTTGRLVIQPEGHRTVLP
ncbi:MAG: hypothetical protein AAFS10_10685 [Myxococcota bacterium]